MLFYVSAYISLQDVYNSNIDVVLKSSTVSLKETLKYILKSITFQSQNDDL